MVAYRNFPDHYLPEYINELAVKGPDREDIRDLGHDKAVWSTLMSVCVSAV